MMRAQALKAARVRNKAAAKAAKAAAEAAASSGNPDVIVTNTNNNNDATVCEVDMLTCAQQRAIAAAATLIQVKTLHLQLNLLVWQTLLFKNDLHFEKKKLTLT